MHFSRLSVIIIIIMTANEACKNWNQQNLPITTDKHVLLTWWKWTQRIKKLISDSLGLVDFTLHLPDGQVKVLGEFFLGNWGKLENWISLYPGTAVPWQVCLDAWWKGKTWEFSDMGSHVSERHYITSFACDKWKWWWMFFFL